jgi:hypothetical protein
VLSFDGLSATTIELCRAWESVGGIFQKGLAKKSDTLADHRIAHEFNARLRMQAR